MTNQNSKSATDFTDYTDYIEKYSHEKAQRHGERSATGGTENG